MSLPVVEPYDMSAASRLPRAAVAWCARPERAVLLIHDLRNELVDAFDPGRSPMVELVHNLGKLRDTCRELGVPVVYSACPDIGAVDALAPKAADTRLDGHFYPALRDLLDRHGRDQLIVTGVRAHAACLMAAAGSHLAGVQVFAVADAVVDVSLDHHRAAVRGAADCGAMITATGQAIGQLLGVLS
ncbi:isochorismatase family protein [Actinokineospora sp.]|uniref:isochorismatase family protein n=1 Tax=Actinokineospora sp. TaxID=1872133 RepID=UPI0040380FBD